MPPKIPPDSRLVDVEDAPLGQRVPAPLHDRIAWLCDVAYEAGEPRRPSKMEMVAALLLGSPTDGQALRQLLKALGEATVADALPASKSKPGELIQLDTRTPGPRSGRGKR
ncbi:MAG: hypothetical protein WKF96_20610 [Solirubrobacteraceae bacterium]